MILPERVFNIAVEKQGFLRIQAKLEQREPFHGHVGDILAVAVRICYRPFLQYPHSTPVFDQGKGIYPVGLVMAAYMAQGLEHRCRLRVFGEERTKAGDACVFLGGRKFLFRQGDFDLEGEGCFGT